VVWIWAGTSGEINVHQTSMKTLSPITLCIYRACTLLWPISFRLAFRSLYRCANFFYPDKSLLFPLFSSPTLPLPISEVMHTAANISPNLLEYPSTLPFPSYPWGALLCKTCTRRHLSHRPSFLPQRSPRPHIHTLSPYQQAKARISFFNHRLSKKSRPTSHLFTHSNTHNHISHYPHPIRRL
jgi:hypothetical protein